MRRRGSVRPEKVLAKEEIREARVQVVEDVLSALDADAAVSVRRLFKVVV